MTYILLTVVVVLLVARFVYVLREERRHKKANLQQVFNSPSQPRSSGSPFFGAAAPKLQQAPLPVSLRRLRNANIRLVWSNPHLYEGPTRKSRAPLTVVK